MKDHKNLECKRCGYQWYSEEYEQKQEMPDNCPRCYQEAVREIPEPPTKIDKIQERIKEEKEALPGRIERKKHEIIIWKENNKLLISLINTALVITLIIGGLMYYLFLR